MTEFENLAGTLKEEAEISFKKYCHNPLLRTYTLEPLFNAKFELCQ